MIFAPGGDVALLDVHAAHVADATGDHDRLVITTQRGAPAGVVAVRNFHLERAEVAEDVRPAELVVERGRAERPVDHDLQRGGDAPRLAVIPLPGLLEPGNLQVRHREAREPRLRLAAATGCALIADLAAGTGGRAGERRDRGRVVVSLHLHQDVDGLVLELVAVVLHVGEPAPAHRAFDHRRVVAIGREHAARIGRVRVLDHGEQRLGLALAVDDPVGVEDLVPAVLGVGLREHHQLDIGRVAAELLEVVGEVIDLVRRQREAELGVRLDQRLTPPRQQRHRAQLARRLMIEQLDHVVVGEHRGFGHPIVERRRHRLQVFGRQRRGAAHEVGDAALDALDGAQAAHLRDVGRLARPGRDRSRPGNDHDERRTLLRRLGRLRRPVGQQRLQDAPLVGAKLTIRLHKVHEARGE